MKRRFNVTGACMPKWHYMVPLDNRLKKIKENYVDYGSYFVINKGRQYGKTTTLRALADYLAGEYFVFSLDFQEMPDEKFENGEIFSTAFLSILRETLRYQEDEEKQRIYGMLSDFIGQNTTIGMDEMFRFLSRMCRECLCPIVLLIDEVDSAGNNQVFVKFLAQLRGAYLKRDQVPTFHSVILAGVYDIKNLKLKIRPESEHQYNSPWNIATAFKVDMDFSVAQIAQMLGEYENDHHTGMNIQEIAEDIYAYTSGYPVLVSAICNDLDEKWDEESGVLDTGSVWSRAGVEEAVQRILIEKTPLFDSMIRQLNEYPEMMRMFRSILFQGDDFSFNPDTKAISLAHMFGYVVNRQGKVRVANRIFETRLYNFFLSEAEFAESGEFGEIQKFAKQDRNQFVRNGKLDMDAVVQKFVEHFSDIWNKNDEDFVEKYGRKFFLLYLKPIINGTGNYYIEAETRDLRRTDVVVDYLGEQFIVELKIWHGNEYNERGEQQVTDYLDYYHKDKGYMISFNFNRKKEIGVKVIMVGDKTVVEAVV